MNTNVVTLCALADLRGPCYRRAPLERLYAERPRLFRAWAAARAGGAALLVGLIALLLWVAAG
jgi:hypothetical protein